MAEFLIDSSMELARIIIFKSMQLCGEKGTTTAMSRTKNVDAVRNFLQPQLDKLESQIRDLAEGVYRTALSHLHHALVILKGRFEELYRPDAQTLLLEKLQNEGKQLPPQALTLLDAAYDKAYNAFNYSGNLSVVQRGRSMQIAMLCIGLLHINEPSVVLDRWEKCIKDLFRDDNIAKSIEQNLKKRNPVMKWFSGHKTAELVYIQTLGRDLIQGATRFVHRKEAPQERVRHIIDLIKNPVELDPETREAWSEKLEAEQHARYIKFRAHLNLKDAGGPFDACAALPDGGVAIAMGNDAVVRYTRELERVKMTPLPGSVYSIAYDPHADCLWGFSGRKNKMLKLDLHSLQEVGEEIDVPHIDVTVARWHMAVSPSGAMFISPQFQRKNDLEKIGTLLYYRETNGEWSLLNVAGLDESRKICDLCATDDKHGQIKLGMMLEGKGFYIKISTTPSIQVKSCRPVLPDVLRDHMACQFDENGRLVIVVRQVGELQTSVARCAEGSHGVSV